MKSILLFSILLSHLYICRGNNIQVSNISLTGQNTDEDFTMVEFDISWENSWRVIGGPNNWDAAWVFIKYRIGAAGTWNHAWLNNTGHSYCAGTTVSNGLLTPPDPFEPTMNPTIGVFLYRDSPGNGTLSCENIQLRWNYGANGILDDAQIDIKVFAIEMVYVPEGPFKVGSGGTESGAFYTYPTTTNPFEITSEDEINVGTTNGYLYYQNPGGACGDQMGPVPASYPKGYNDFYVMKYEISQKGYVDFLNTLSRAQQVNRVASDINATQFNNAYIMANYDTPVSRNGIWTYPIRPPVSSPIKVFCNINNNVMGNESDDGLNIACNFLSWKDLVAYLDWAGLRPITELEFEKAARGEAEPFPNEFCWGNTYIIHAYIIYESLTESETVLPEFNIFINAGLGPLRCGAMAREGTDRTFAGASYYGILDLSGNVWELGVNAGSISGRSFIGNHGDGLLTTTGFDNTPYWPNSSGYYFRGGSFLEQTSSLNHTISFRFFANYVNPQRNFNYGGRGCRTSAQ